MDYKFSAPLNEDRKRTVLLSFGRKDRTLCIDTGLELPMEVRITNNMVVGTDAWSEQMNRRLDYVLALAKGFAESKEMEAMGNAEIIRLMERRLNHVVSAPLPVTPVNGRDCQMTGTGDSGANGKALVTLVSLTDRRISQCRAEGRHDAVDRLTEDRKWLLKYFKDIPAGQVRKKHILEFQRMLEKENRCGYFSEQTIVRLKATWKTAKENKWFTPSSSPFENFKATYKGEPKQCDLKESEFQSLIRYRSKDRKLLFARDMYLLMFYLGGMSLETLYSLDLRGNRIEYLYMANKNPTVATPTVFRIQPEARKIIRRWFPDGRVLNPFSTKGGQQLAWYSLDGWLKQVRAKLGLENLLTPFSARRTFCHFAYKLGVNQNIIKYCIGQSSFTRNVICNYVQVAEQQADKVFRTVIDYALGNGTDIVQHPATPKDKRYVQPEFKSSFTW